MSILLQALDSNERLINVSEEAAQLSITVKNMLEDMSDYARSGVPVPIPGVSHVVLEKVVEFSEHHAVSADDNWEKNFCSNNFDMIYDLIIAANYLDMRCLLDKTCAAVAERLNGKTPDQIREFFGITDADDPVELAKKHSWCAED
jgi:hypothetical protein